jgi:uncharacterized protein YjbJ (UPF0337 family)
VPRHSAISELENFQAGESLNSTRGAMRRLGNHAHAPIATKRPQPPSEPINMHERMELSLRRFRFLIRNYGDTAMDKDRIKGVAQQAKGNIKKAIGALTGDAKLKTEGEMDKIEGKVRNAVGGAKDALRQQDQKNR